MSAVIAPASEQRPASVLLSPPVVKGPPGLTRVFTDKYPWFSPAQKNMTPSRADGISAQDERLMRMSACLIIRMLGRSLKLQSVTVGVACTYLQVFYQRLSLKEFHYELAAITCLFLACKVEDERRSTRDVMNVYLNQIRLQFAMPDDESDSLRHLMIRTEAVLLDAVEFNFWVKLPHAFLVDIVHALHAQFFVDHKPSLDGIGGILHGLVEDSLSSTLAFDFAPRVVAVGCAFLALEIATFKGQISVPNFSVEAAKNYLSDRFDVSKDDAEHVSRIVNEINFDARDLRHGERCEIREGDRLINVCTSNLHVPRPGLLCYNCHARDHTMRCCRAPPAFRRPDQVQAARAAAAATAASAALQKPPARPADRLPCPRCRRSLTKVEYDEHRERCKREYEQERLRLAQMQRRSSGLSLAAPPMPRLTPHDVVERPQSQRAHASRHHHGHHHGHHHNRVNGRGHSHGRDGRPQPNPQAVVAPIAAVPAPEPTLALGPAPAVPAVATPSEAPSFVPMVDDDATVSVPPSVESTSAATTVPVSAPNVPGSHPVESPGRARPPKRTFSDMSSQPSDWENAAAEAETSDSDEGSQGKRSCNSSVNGGSHSRWRPSAPPRNEEPASPQRLERVVPTAKPSLSPSIANNARSLSPPRSPSQE